MTPRRVFLTLSLLLLPAPAVAQDLHLGWLLGATCSLAADAADLASTVYAHQQRADVAEGNPLYADGFEGDGLAWPLVLKSAGAAGVVWGAWELERREHRLAARLLLWGNCAGKIALTVHNLRIAHESPRPKGLRVTVPILRLSWR